MCPAPSSVLWGGTRVERDSVMWGKRWSFLWRKTLRKFRRPNHVLGFFFSIRYFLVKRKISLLNKHLLSNKRAVRGLCLILMTVWSSLCGTRVAETFGGVFQWQRFLHTLEVSLENEDRGQCVQGEIWLCYCCYYLWTNSEIIAGKLSMLSFSQNIFQENNMTNEIILK